MGDVYFTYLSNSYIHSIHIAPRAHDSTMAKLCLMNPWFVDDVLDEHRMDLLPTLEGSGPTSIKGTLWLFLIFPKLRT